MPNLFKSPLFTIIKRDLLEYNGRIIICKGEYCGGDSQCQGVFYFDAKETPMIKVARGKTSQQEAFGVLIHEYSHFLQWRDQSKIWNEFDENDFSFDNVILKPKKNKDKILLLIKLEADCERRSIKIIRKNQILDDKVYAQMANAVLYKYAYLYHYGTWPRGAKLKETYSLCPDKILKSYKDYLNIPEDVKALYDSVI